MNYKRVLLFIMLCIIIASLSIWSPLLALFLVLVIPVAYGFILFPIIGLVILAFSGRFSRIPPFNDFDGPIYVGLILIIIIFITLLLRKNKIIIVSNKSYLALNSIFAIYLLIGIFINHGSEYGITKALEFSLYILPMVFLILVMVKTKDKFWFFIKIIMLLSLIFAITGLLTGELGSGRLSVLGGGSNVYGRFMVYGIISVLPFIHTYKSLFLKLLFIVLISLFVLLTFLSGSRQAIIGIFIAIFLYVFLHLIKASYTKKVKILLFSSFVTITGVILSPVVIKNFLDGTLAWNRLALLFEDDKGGSVSARTDMLRGAWEMFKEKPLLGWGTGSFADEYSYIMRYPHNLTVEILSENGIVGILIFILIIVVSLRCAFKVLKVMDKPKDIRLIITIITFFLVSVYFSQISGDLYDSRWIWLFGSLLAGIPYAFNHSSKAINLK